MKEYIKPKAELIEYSFDDVIAAGSIDTPEPEIPDIEVPDIDF